jgi:2-phospho-L-lactate transferase/gluconeogenesis factor (CofD/UPF0052 family)
MRFVLPPTTAVRPQMPQYGDPPPALEKLKVVAIGGGTGLPIVLRGLKHALFSAEGAPPSPELDDDRLTAIVTVADDGGSSGRLRQAYGVPPPGDVRNCLLALAARDSKLTALFDYRFEGGDEVSGHSLGNLILTALSRMENDFPRAIERAPRSWVSGAGCFPRPPRMSACGPSSTTAAGWRASHGSPRFPD